MSEPRDERDQDQRPCPKRVSCRDAAIAAGFACSLACLLPCMIIYSLVTGVRLIPTIFAIWWGLSTAMGVGPLCGLIGWWLTRNSSVDSRVMACTLAAIVELTVLGWLIEIELQLQAY